MVMGRRFRGCITTQNNFQFTAHQKHSQRKREGKGGMGREGEEKERESEDRGGGEEKHNCGFMASITDISHLV